MTEELLSDGNGLRRCPSMEDLLEVTEMGRARLQLTFPKTTIGRIRRQLSISKRTFPYGELR
jgi:hypothetical protein